MQPVAQNVQLRVPPVLEFAIEPDISVAVVKGEHGHGCFPLSGFALNRSGRLSSLQFASAVSHPKEGLRCLRRRVLVRHHPAAPVKGTNIESHAAQTGARLTLPVIQVSFCFTKPAHNDTF
jgi:hypothetical protein